MTDQKDGTATVERTVENNDIQFKNTYQAEGSTSLIIHKQLTGGTLKAKHLFDQFVVMKHCLSNHFDVFFE